MDNNTTDLGTKTTIFKQEQGQQETYRIPALIYISEIKTYFAFAEKRKTPNDTDADVFVLRRGKWNDNENNVKWESPEVLSSSRLPDHRSMNPCPVYERESKTLFLFFICVPNGVSEQKQIDNNKNQARLCYITSKDFGENWNETKDLTKSVIGERENDWATFGVGPGHGVQRENLRLIIPAYAYIKSNGQSTSHAFAFYSKDKGESWNVGDYIKGESNECQMAEIIDEEGKSTLYCNARSKSGHRVQALSKKDEDFDEPLPDDTLKETGGGCQGSVLKIHYPNQGTWLLYSHPSNEQQRKDLGIYVNKSPLNPKEWMFLIKINYGPSGYSDLAECGKNGYIACLMECGEKTEMEEIAFKFFKIKIKFLCACQ